MMFNSATPERTCARCLLIHAVDSCPLPMAPGISRCFKVNYPDHCALCDEDIVVGPYEPDVYGVKFKDFGLCHRECLLAHLTPFAGVGTNEAIPLEQRMDQALATIPVSVATLVRKILVEHATTRYLCVVSGPGTGKTLTISLLSKIIGKKNILVVSWNKHTVIDLRRRGVISVTMHALGMTMIRSGVAQALRNGRAAGIYTADDVGKGQVTLVEYGRCISRRPRV